MTARDAEALSHVPTGPRLRATSGTALAVSVAGAILVAVGLANDSPQAATLGMMIALCPLLIALSLKPVWAFGAWLLATAALNVTLFQVSFNLGPRLYLLDVFCLVTALAAVAYSRQHAERDRNAASRTTAVLVVIMAFAALQSARGALAGHVMSDNLGTLRRLFIYPTAGFLIAYAFLRVPANVRSMTRALWGACALLAGIFAYRLLTGSGYRAEAFEANQDVIRYLSYPEALTLITGATLALSLWIWTHPRRHSSGWVLVGLACVALVIASNYRTSWIALAVGLVSAAAAIASRSPGKSLRLLGVAVTGSGLLVVVLLLTPLHELLARKLSSVNLAQTGTWRWFSWLQAWRVFREHVWWGVGLGYRHAFWTPGDSLQAGTVVTGNEIHNDALWILVNTGVTGLLLWLGIAGLLIQGALRSLRTLSDPVVLAMLCAACALMGAVTVSAMLQPTLSLGGTGVWLGAVGALFVRTEEWTRAA